MRATGGPMMWASYNIQWYTSEIFYKEDKYSWPIQPKIFKSLIAEDLFVCVYVCVQLMTSFLKYEHDCISSCLCIHMGTRKSDSITASSSPESPQFLVVPFILFSYIYKLDGGGFSPRIC